MKHTTHILSLLIGIFSLYTLKAQELQPLKKDYRSSISITKAEVVSETSERLNLSFECNAQSGKSYQISAIALDKNRKPVKEVQAEAQDLAEGTSIVDLSFRFQQLNDKNYQAPKMETQYIQVMINEKRKVNEILDKYNLADGKNKGLEDLNNALSVKYLYTFQKEWRVGGNDNMVIEVTLNPIGKAQLIKY